MLQHGKPCETTRPIQMKRPLLLMLFVGVLAACEAPPRIPQVEALPAPAPEPVPPPTAPEPAPAVAGPPASPEGRQQAQKLALAAADLLQSGNEDGARTELKRALTLDGQNKLALSLSRQMTADPMTTLGRENFAYTVRPGDTLALLAQRQLGDAYLFYVLARYNDLKVPKQLSSGQVIRLPGKASVMREPSPPSASSTPTVPTPRTTPPVAAPPSSPPTAPPQPPALPPPPPAPMTPGEQAMRDGTAAERASDLPRALIAYRKADSLGQAGASVKADQMRTLLVGRHTLAARNAFTKQDLDGAIANWQRVIDLDANNGTAHSELERSKVLKKKLTDLPK